MAHIDCEVNTRPMAQEIDSVSKHITLTTAAVVGLKAAVISAEEEATTKVCNDVNRGFYALIHSQISQKIAKLQSEVDSHLMKLNQHSKQLGGIKLRMERDYGMLCGRYSKLFSGLNKNLENRVFALDKPTIDFAVKEINAVSNRTKQLSAVVPVSQLESLTASQKMVASSLKNRGMRVLSSMNNFLGDMKAQEIITHSILLPQRCRKEMQPIMVPVIVRETNNSRDDKHIDIYVNSSELPQRAQDSIKNSVNTYPLQWQTPAGGHNELRSEFNRCLSNSNSSQRVKDMVEKLFAEANFQTIKTE